MLFSANLGFLWTDRSLPDAIHAAKTAGFDAVECHWPYETPVKDVKVALESTGLEMLGLNTSKGEAGQNGLSALVGREDDAKAAIDQSVTYGSEIGAKSIHVMAGFADGDDAHKTFVSNLKYACEQAASQSMKILIEPLNEYDAPGYFLQTTEQALTIIKDVAADNIKLMFDCYHVQLMEGDLSNKLEQLQSSIGHIQFASVPDRGAPDHGEISYQHIFEKITELGFKAPIGAEYKPDGDTDVSLGWLKTYR